MRHIHANYGEIQRWLLAAAWRHVDRNKRFSIFLLLLDLNIYMTVAMHDSGYASPSVDSTDICFYR